MRLHYLVKLRIRVFVKILMHGKAKLKKFVSLALILLIKKDATFRL